MVRGERMGKELLKRNKIRGKERERGEGKGSGTKQPKLLFFFFFSLFFFPFFHRKIKATTGWINGNCHHTLSLQHCFHYILVKTSNCYIQQCWQAAFQTTPPPQHRLLVLGYNY
eukprot:TRINITY_DN7211_c0_g1_i1.p1 TRINITY_DN7211_c0_g1~~TRINITY_DN7211_c0_g1_i1.p1  ORF type:complete len:114 (-),score=0.94 TRINITY_DN7211_c0_g1_i1:149-490(-)